ncbi:hypothetical protein [Microbispora bryophytorum]|uniref:hypothetical protein n=1 Tax=Microbispora bryophytorum TaxID=1460882 RepID=UPI0037133682
MNSADASTRSVFGVPAVLTQTECSTLLNDLMSLWSACYDSEISDLQSDLDRCRHFFDPVARGQSLRTRLAAVEPASPHMRERIAKFGKPLVVEAGEDVLLVGVEARLMIELLSTSRNEGNYIALSDSAIGNIEREALSTYRQWAMHRLNQVIDLRSGNGKEPLQLVSVGLVLALLVNRSTTVRRAVIQRDHNTQDGKDVDSAIHAGAEAFASTIHVSRRGRSSGEQRLKGGWPLTEARRRLAHRLLVEPGDKPGEKLIFVPEKAVDDVIAFLGVDLARRPISANTLEQAYDDLVAAFKASTHALAYRSMVFDRKAETSDLKQRLVESFSKARSMAGQ